MEPASLLAWFGALKVGWSPVRKPVTPAGDAAVPPSRVVHADEPWETEMQ
jgi:hypothetical protein